MPRPLKKIICPRCNMERPAASFYYNNSKNKRELCSFCRELNAEHLAVNTYINQQKTQDIKENMEKGLFWINGAFVYDYKRWLRYKAMNIPKFFSKKAHQTRCKRRNGLVPSGYVYAYELFCLWEAQKGVCGLTGELLNPRTCQLDHIIPIEHNGLNVISNVWWVKREANASKKDLPLDLYCQWKNLNYSEIYDKINTIQATLKTKNIQLTSPSLSE